MMPDVLSTWAKTIIKNHKIALFEKTIQSNSNTFAIGSNEKNFESINILVTFDRKMLYTSGKPTFSGGNRHGMSPMHKFPCCQEWFR